MSDAGPSVSASPHPRRIGGPAAWTLGVAVLGSALLYSSIISHELVPSWDDAAYLLNRPEVLHWSAVTWRDRLLTPLTGYPTPVPTAVWASIHAFGAGVAGGAHAASLIAHLVNVMLAAALLRRWMPPVSAAASTAVWACHPVLVESVAWATNLKTLLWAGFTLTALLAWEAVLDRRSRSWLLAASFLWLCAAGCRPEAALMPALFSFAALRRGRTVAREHARFLGGSVVVAGAFVAVAELGHSAIAARSSLAEQSVAGRAYAVFRSATLYTEHLVAPVDLQPSYFLEQPPDWALALPGAAVLAAVPYGAWHLWKRGQRDTLALLAVATSLLAPSMQLVFIPRLAADTYLYLPCLFFVGAAVNLVAPRWSPRRLALVVGALCGLGVIVTSSQISRWQDAVALWEPLLERHPGVARPYRHTAFGYFGRGRPDLAARVLDEGMPQMRRQGNVPFWAPAVYEAAGAHQRAVEVAVIGYHAASEQSRPLHARSLLDTLVRTGRQIPSELSGEDVSRIAAEYARHPEWLRSAPDALELAIYLESGGKSEQARELATEAARLGNLRCEAWASSLSPHLPPRPEHCSAP